MPDQVAQLVHRTTLDEEIGPQTSERLLEPRRAVDDGQLRFLQPTRHQVVEHCTPSCFAFATHAADGKQYFLPVRGARQARSVKKSMSTCGLPEHAPPFHRGSNVPCLPCEDLVCSMPPSRP